MGLFDRVRNLVTGHGWRDSGPAPAPPSEPERVPAQRDERNWLERARDRVTGADRRREEQERQVQEQRQREEVEHQRIEQAVREQVGRERQELDRQRQELVRQRQEVERQRAEIEAQRPQREEFERQERQRIEREVREQVERGQREQREQEQERQRQERERQERERAELLEKERREREQAARKPQTVGDIVKDALAADRQRQQEEREWKEKNRSQSSPSVDGIPSLGIPGISGLPGGATIYATESSDELMRRLDEAARAGKRVSISVLDKNGWHKLYTNTGRDKGRGMSASEMQRRFEKYGVPGQEKVGVAGPITTQYEPTG